jgi:hypothetical protein
MLSQIPLHSQTLSDFIYTHGICGPHHLQASPLTLAWCVWWGNRAGAFVTILLVLSLVLAMRTVPNPVIATGNGNGNANGPGLQGATYTAVSHTLISGHFAWTGH